MYPVGSYPEDVDAVRAAVDAGGSVRLAAVDVRGEPTAFDFGPAEPGSGSVSIGTDVAIRGETRGPWKTTIRGGSAPFASDVQVETSIRGIRFEGPVLAAIFLQPSAGAEIESKEIVDVVGAPDPFPGFPDFRKGLGMWILGRPGGGIGPVTGRIRIAHNTIDGVDAENSIGIALVGFEADAEIVQNVIRDAPNLGIFAFDHIGSVRVAKNVVVPGPPTYFTQGGNAISIGPVYRGLFESDPAPGPAYVLDNEVVCENPYADGILIFGLELPIDGSVIAGNRVTMHDSFYGGISLVDDVSRTLVFGNRVRGSGAYALDALDVFPPAVPIRRNVFLANDVSAFEESFADLYLDSSIAETLVVGCHGVVVDKGTDNRILGCRGFTGPSR